MLKNDTLRIIKKFVFLLTDFKLFDRILKKKEAEPPIISGTIRDIIHT